MLKRTLVGKYVKNLKVFTYVPFKKLKLEYALEDTDEYVIRQYDNDDDIILSKDGTDISSLLYDKKIESKTIIDFGFFDISLGHFDDYEMLDDYVKKVISKDDFEGNVLFISNYLVSSGSNRVEMRNCFVYDGKLNLEYKEIIPPIGTSDLKSFKIFTLIPKKEVADLNLDEAIIRFIPEYL